MKLTELAPAKLNLTLEVGEKRSDGYHEVQSVMSCAALYDEVTLESGTSGGISMTCDCPGLPTKIFVSGRQSCSFKRQVYPAMVCILSFPSVFPCSRVWAAAVPMRQQFCEACVSSIARR